MPNRARYYDPGTGRFLSEDPIGFAGKDSNIFRYVSSSPVYFTDPTGKFWQYVMPILIGGAITYLVEDVLTGISDDDKNVDWFKPDQKPGGPEDLEERWKLDEGIRQIQDEWLKIDHLKKRKDNPGQCEAA